VTSKKRTYHYSTLLENDAEFVRKNAYFNTLRIKLHLCYRTTLKLTLNVFLVFFNFHANGLRSTFKDSARNLQRFRENLTKEGNLTLRAILSFRLLNHEKRC